MTAKTSKKNKKNVSKGDSNEQQGNEEDNEKSLECILPGKTKKLRLTVIIRKGRKGKIAK